MFTGIISDIGEIISHETNGDTTLRIRTNYDSDTIKLGESIACNGCCLTVIDNGILSPPLAGGLGGESYFDVQLSAETLACTTDCWHIGSRINLERALKVGDNLSGHFVTGHVDGVAELVDISSPLGGERLRASPKDVARSVGGKSTDNITPHDSNIASNDACFHQLPPKGGAKEVSSYTLTFSIPDQLTTFIAPKGSVTLNGVSLTVNQTGGNQFTTNIIPHTWQHTNFSMLEIGGKVNLEVDVLARYVVRQKER